MQPARVPVVRRIPVAARHAAVAKCALLVHMRLSAARENRVESARVSVHGIEEAFGAAEVRVALVCGPELRYVYVNASYRSIRAEVPMVGHTYREVFPEAAAAGAEARLQAVMTTGESWIVDDYATPLPGRDVPAWWQGECVPVSMAGGADDAVLILIWDVTRRHLPLGPAVLSREQTSVEAMKGKLMAHMASLGLLARYGWTISEEVVETPEGTRWTVRPLHLYREAPPLEMSIVFDFRDHRAEAD